MEKPDPAEFDARILRGDPTLEALEVDEPFWRKARIVMPDEQRKVPVRLRLDRDVVDYSKQQGKGYQPRINAVLRSFVEAQRR